MLFFYLLNLIGLILMMVSFFTSSALFCLSGILIILLSTNSIIHRKIKSDDIFSPLFVSTMTLIVSCGLGSILYYSIGAFPEDILDLALIYVITFTISFIFGFSFNLGSVLSKSLPKLKPDFSVKRLRFTTILFLPIG